MYLLMLLEVAWKAYTLSHKITDRRANQIFKTES